VTRLSLCFARHAAAVVLATSLVGCAVDHAPIAIGLVGPFSQARGVSMRLGAELAVNEINRDGGVRGRRLTLVVEDDSAAPEAAVAAARQLYANPHVVAVIGHLTSAATLAAAPIYNGGKRPLVAISPSASAPSVSSAGPYVFRVCPTDVVHGTRLADFARQQLKARTAAILYQNDEYGRGIRETFATEFTARGGRLITDDPYVLDLPSFEPYLRRLRMRGGADVLLIAGTEAAAQRILPTLDTVGIHPRVLGGDALSGLEATPEGQGVFMSAAYLPDQPGARNEAFVRAYHAAYPRQPLDHRGAAAYDIVHLLAAAMAQAGPNRSGIRDYLVGIGRAHPSFEGVTGRIVFDEHGDVPNKAVVVGVVRDGRLVTAQTQ
jgi:branched-chain amino acid transport system substrate-binding protein